MRKKIKTAVMLLIILFVLIAPSLGEEQEDDGNPITSEFIKQRMIERNFAIDPNALKYIENENDVIATFGVMPELESGLESYNWWISICNITDEISEDKALEQYLLGSGGFCGGYGTFADGTIRIIVGENFRDSVTDEELKEVVEIVEKYAEKEGITSAPIVFLVIDPPAPAVLMAQPPTPYGFVNNFIIPASPVIILFISACLIACLIGAAYKHFNKEP